MWKAIVFFFGVFFLLIIPTVILHFSGNFVLRKNPVSKNQPNIILVVADDYGWNDIGYHGSEIRTPTLDKLASEGVKLENYYVQPVCTPSRSQLLSGMYQIHTGLQHHVIYPSVPNGLPIKFPTMADKLKEAGYSTHIVGKWHIGFYTRAHLPTSRGFDSFYGYLGGGGNYYNSSMCNNGMCGFDFWENNKPIYNTARTYSTTLLASKAVDVITKHDPNKPLFLYLPFKAVHGPLQVPEEYTKPYDFIKNKNRRLYAGMVGCMDEAVHNVTRSLKEHGLWENTLFIFTTDNGGYRYRGGSNWPLRGGKHELWEGGIRGVAFVTGPLLDKRVRGTISRALMDVSDWYPTLVNLAEGDLYGPQPLDGVDQWNTINGGPTSRSELLHNIDPLQISSVKSRKYSPFDTTVTAALRHGDWKILTGSPGEGVWAPRSTMKGLMQTVLDTTSQNVWLFNITADPLEQHNVAERYPQVVDKLLGKLKEYEDTAVPCRFPKQTRKANPKLRGGFWGPWI